MNMVPPHTDGRQVRALQPVRLASLVPTTATRDVAHRMIQDAALTNGADATLRSLPLVDPAQMPALLGVILTATKVHGKLGRPALPLWFSPEERREAHRLYRRGDRTPRVLAAHREYNRVNQRAARTRRPRGVA